MEEEEEEDSGDSDVSADQRLIKKQNEAGRCLLEAQEAIRSYKKLLEKAIIAHNNARLNLEQALREYERTERGVDKITSDIINRVKNPLQKQKTKAREEVSNSSSDSSSGCGGWRCRCCNSMNEKQ